MRSLRSPPVGASSASLYRLRSEEKAGVVTGNREVILVVLEGIDIPSETKGRAVLLQPIDTHVSRQGLGKVLVPSPARGESISVTVASRELTDYYLADRWHTELS